MEGTFIPPFLGRMQEIFISDSFFMEGKATVAKVLWGRLGCDVVCVCYFNSAITTELL